MWRRFTDWMDAKSEIDELAKPVAISYFGVATGLFTAAIGVLGVLLVHWLFKPSLIGYAAPHLMFATALATATSTGLLGGGLLGLTVGRNIHRLVRQKTILEHLSQTDSLTDLLNRRALLSRFERLNAETSLALFDIDRFKTVNDSFGHLAGDRVIQAVAKALVKVFPSPHVVARLGGEEFAVVVFGTSASRRLASVDAARMAIATLPVVVDRIRIPITVSVGVASAAAGSSFDEAYGIADAGLYAAKSLGRNRIVDGNVLRGLDPFSPCGAVAEVAMAP